MCSSTSSAMSVSTSNTMLSIDATPALAPLPVERASARKAGGFDKVPMKDIFEGIYEYATISVSLDKADMTTRIDNLNEKNLEIFIKCENLLKENELLKQRLQEKQTTNESY